MEELKSKYTPLNFLCFAALKAVFICKYLYGYLQRGYAINVYPEQEMCRYLQLHVDNFKSICVKAKTRFKEMSSNVSLVFRSHASII